MSDGDMPDKRELPQDVQEYLEKIRETVRKSEALIEMAELRIAETDRFLEKHGLTRDSVTDFIDKQNLTPEQRRMIEEQLEQWNAEVESDVEHLRAQYADTGDVKDPDDVGRRAEKLRNLNRQFRL